MKASEKTAPFVASDSTTRGLRPILSYTKGIFKDSAFSCALARKNSGAFVFP